MQLKLALIASEGGSNRHQQVRANDTMSRVKVVSICSHTKDVFFYFIFHILYTFKQLR